MGISDRHDRLSGCVGVGRSMNITSCLKSAALRLAIIAPAIMAAAQFCEAAPQQLLEKTVVLDGEATIVVQRNDGTVYTQKYGLNRIIYISKLGRIFSRTTTGASGSTVKHEQAPGEKSDERRYRIEGSALVSRETVNGIYSDLVISFDPAFRTCTVSQKTSIVGPQRDSQGNTIQVTSITRANQTCAVREGNPFGT
jgi:hypothetical protein